MLKTQISFLPLLRCPACSQSLTLETSTASFILSTGEKDEHILEGQLSCRCGRSYPIQDGLPILVYPEDLPPLDSLFKIDRLSRLSQIELRHFWFVGRRVLLDQLLNRFLGNKAQQVLDLGCGTGLMVDILMRQGHHVVGLDLRPEGLSAIHKALPQSWLLQAEATRLPLKENTFDAVMLLDVLEHVDDRLLLAEVRRVLRPGGVAVITVPAMPWLWSYRDEAAGHLRRYTRRQLTGLLDGAQFQLLKISYYQCLLFPLVLVTRLSGRKGPGMRDLEDLPFPALNTVMTWINKLEVRLSDIISWPWGSSLVAVCRRS